VLSLDKLQEAVAKSSSVKPDADFECDIADAGQLQKVFEAERVDGIIHLAAVLPTAAQRDPALATRVNIGGSLNLLEMARQFDVRRFVFASSLSAYGTHSAEELVSEECHAVPEDLYGVAKLYVERLGEIYRRQRALQFVSLRIGRVVGPGARSQSSAWRSRIFEEIRTTEPREIVVPFDAAERLLLVHVDDIAKMLLTLLKTTQTEYSLYNACCESVSVANLKREIESLNLNVTVKLGTGEAACNPQLLDCGRFEQEFGFRPVPIFEQLRRAAGREPLSRNVPSTQRIGQQ
jgi:UDP-glucuronate 4-epimerase